MIGTDLYYGWITFLVWRKKGLELTEIQNRGWVYYIRARPFKKLYRWKKVRVWILGARDYIRHFYLLLLCPEPIYLYFGHCTWFSFRQPFSGIYIHVTKGQWEFTKPRECKCECIHLLIAIILTLQIERAKRYFPKEGKVESRDREAWALLTSLNFWNQQYPKSNPSFDILIVWVIKYPFLFCLK